MRPVEKAVLAGIHDQETTELLRTLVRTPSGNPPGDERRVAEVLADFLHSTGSEPQLHEVEPGRANLVALFDTGAPGPTLMLNGHLDTMPAGPGWTTDPLGGIVRDGHLFGLGAADQKSGLAAMAVAAAAVRRAGLPRRGRLLLTGVVDEEGGGLGARRLVEQGLQADCAVITEPTELGLVRVSNGQLNVELLVRGKSAHGSTPESGRNAIEAAARVILALGEHAGRLRARTHPLIGPTTLNVGTIHGGLVTSIVPAECRFTIDRRVIPGDTIDGALADLDELLDRLRAQDPALEVERRVMMAVPPVEVPEDLPLCRIMRDATARILGRDLGYTGLRGSTDAATFQSAGIPTVIFGPGSLSKSAHRADEWVPLADVHAATRILALSVARFLT
jgi:acetylornithine deacetylase/succinyl-diaminopimelate desuccinylase family protein